MPAIKRALPRSRGSAEQNDFFFPLTVFELDLLFIFSGERITSQVEFALKIPRFVAMEEFIRCLKRDADVVRKITIGAAEILGDCDRLSLPITCLDDRGSTSGIADKNAGFHVHVLWSYIAVFEQGLPHAGPGFAEHVLTRGGVNPDWQIQACQHRADFGLENLHPILPGSLLGAFPSGIEVKGQSSLVGEYGQYVVVLVELAQLFGHDRVPPLPISRVGAEFLAGCRVDEGRVQVKGSNLGRLPHHIGTVMFVLFRHISADQHGLEDVRFRGSFRPARFRLGLLGCGGEETGDGIFYDTITEPPIVSRDKVTSTTVSIQDSGCAYSR